MLQIARVTAFTFSELLKENQKKKKKAPKKPTQTRVKIYIKNTHFSLILYVKNQLGISFNVPRESSQFHHTFFEFYIYEENMLLKKDLQKQLCHTFLELNINEE